MDPATQYPTRDRAEDEDATLARDGAVGEWYALPSGEKQWLKLRFLPAPAARQGGRLPAILCLIDEESGGPSAAEFCHHAHDRGISLLLADVGASFAPECDAAEYHFDREAAISRLVDYLQGRIDVDPDKIAIFGRGLLAALATRVAHYDGRFAAAVCDAGIWDSIGRAFMDRAWCCDQPQDMSLDLFARSSIALAIRCPILVAVGDDDWLEPDHAERCCSLLAAAGKRIAFKRLPATGTFSAADHAGRTTLNNEAVFDWLAQCITGSA